jgi:hypothetical protein
LAAVKASAEDPPAPTPESLLKTLDPFYKQHTVAADGLLIVCSEKVSEHAMLEARYLAENMLAKRPDVLQALNDRRMYFSVMAYTEMQNDLPECRNMSDWWAFRCRGIGGRASSCGEENLLCFEGDPWKGENIFIHEFAHALEGIFSSLDEGFKKRFEAEFEKAKESGRLRGYCIDGGIGEFWAEGVQAWFNCNGAIRPKSGGGQSSFQVIGPNGEDVCHLRTREQVKKHLPEYAKLLDETFRGNEWVYEPVLNRLDQPHLRGYDPSKAPMFRFPPEVVAAFDREEAEKAAKKKIEAEKKQRETEKKDQSE